ncbi:hypothetical protein GOP47_0019287 [Adiantum capillus-veneris]|uniref:ENTH domain-containing protein n=1 Tax=Adiantum capillus-veneris TaxID=13818 RepID=A0A9D4UFR8_ADICA|nr:hypothetical protein GOP47_0019287 [Adiantum capillus-veneris]
MAGWIKKRIKLQEFMGLMKDQVSLGRAMAKAGQFSQIDLAVLRATGHEEHIVEEETVKAVLEVGGGSRMRVSHCIRFIMDRLNKTHSWIVALKCLLLIHKCLHEGGFMFQDQLSIHPSTGGHNYLNLSKFRDTSSAFTWATSAWVRWYARFIEQWIQTSRSMGTFLDLKKEDKSLHRERLMSLASSQLVKEMINLEELLHEGAGWEAEDFVMEHVLVKKAIGLITKTTGKAYRELKSQFEEVTERISTLVRPEALALLDVCERLSEDSMSLLQLFETGESICNDGASGHIVYTYFELQKLKETLRHASLHNLSASPQHTYLEQGHSQMWKSARWERIAISNLGIRDTRKGFSFSEFDFN